MSGSSLLLLSMGLFISAGILIVWMGVLSPYRPLRVVVSELERSGQHTEEVPRRRRWRTLLSERFESGIDPVALTLVDRTPQMQLTRLASYSLGATVLIGSLAVPVSVVIGPGLLPAVLIAVVAGVAAPALAQHLTSNKIQLERADLRYQLSGYLDLVTVLLAGNLGHEGALRRAADLGDGRLFARLRLRMSEQAIAGHGCTTALGATGRDLGLVELEQVTTSIDIAATEGAAVARTLSAVCESLRSSLAAQQEAEARLRTGRLSAPLIGMALLFMGLVMYPALTAQ